MLYVISIVLILALAATAILGYGLMRVASRNSREDEITELHYIKTKTEGDSQ